MKTEREIRLEGALRALVEEHCDYMMINSLGDPEKQHNIKRAREALSDEDLGGGDASPALERFDRDYIGTPPQRREALEALAKEEDFLRATSEILRTARALKPEFRETVAGLIDIFRRALSEPAVPSVPDGLLDSLKDADNTARRLWRSRFPMTKAYAFTIRNAVQQAHDTLQSIGHHEETPAEAVLRSLASWLGMGGYNAPRVDPEQFEAKIREGVETLVRVEKERAAAVPEAVRKVMDELGRAREKFPQWPDDPIHAATVVSEEAGELAQAALQSVYEPNKQCSMHDEAVQTAAMAIRFLENMQQYEMPSTAQHDDRALAQSGEGRVPEPPTYTAAMCCENCGHRQEVRWHPEPDGEQDDG